MACLLRTYAVPVVEALDIPANIPVVEAAGKPFELGRSVGKRCSAKARAYQSAMAAAVKHCTGFEWAKAVGRAKAFLPHAEDFYPDYVEELRGYSEGAGLPFEEVFAMCCHELLSADGFRGCTDMAASGEVTAAGNVLVSHNEDWSGKELGTVVLLHARPRGKPAFIATSYAGFIHSTGMNSAGISLTGNALSQNDTRVGIPKLFPVRKVLEARRIGEALTSAMPPGRASSYNNICADGNGEIYSLEGSATDCAWLYALDGYLVHTNHYISERMRRYEASEPASLVCSTVRHNRAVRLVEAQLGEITVDSLKSILADHVNRPGSICRHPDPKKDPIDDSETIFSIIYDLTKLEAYVCKDKPCAGRYSKVGLRGG